MKKTNTLRIFLIISGVFTFFWWPMSHWFYPDWYHKLLGFTSYDAALVKIIGTIGIFPVLCTLFAARDIRRNQDMILILIIFCVLMAATYVFLIITMNFPVLEIINVAILLISALTLGILFPRSA